MTRLLIFFILAITFSCQEPKNLDQRNSTSNSSDIKNVANSGSFDSLKNLTVLKFLDRVIITEGDSKKLNFITIEDDNTSVNWVKPEDIDTLITLVKSRNRCRCIVDPLSSHLPTDNYAELGGYAMSLLRQYKNKMDIRFSLYACPKTNEKEADELVKWWIKTKKSGSRQL